MSEQVYPLGAWQMRLCTVCGMVMVSDRGSTLETCSQDCFEEWLEKSEQERFDALPPATDEQRRRVVALTRFECPDHACDLEEIEDTDEHGPHVFYVCRVGDHLFGSVHDSVGGYAPADDEIGVVAIERVAIEREAGL